MVVSKEEKNSCTVTMETYSDSPEYSFNEAVVWQVKALYLFILALSLYLSQQLSKATNNSKEAIGKLQCACAHAHTEMHFSVTFRKIRSDSMP